MKKRAGWILGIVWILACVLAILVWTGVIGNTDALNIYYLADNRESEAMIKSYLDADIDATAFESIEEMDARIVKDMASGEMPDLILFTKGTALDVEKMAQEGIFADLSPLMEADDTFETENYYQVLDAGIYDGKQIVMPLRFSLWYFLSSEERLAESAITFAERDNAIQMMQAIGEASQTGRENGGILNNQVLESASLLYDMMRLSGVDFLSEEGAAVGVSEDLVKEYADFGRMMYEQSQKAADAAGNAGGSVSAVYSATTMFLHDQQLPVTFCKGKVIYDIGFEEQAILRIWPNYEDGSAVTADITLYAAVSADSEKMEAAYAFIRSAMDHIINNSEQDLCVNRENVEDYLRRESRVSSKELLEWSLEIEEKEISVSRLNVDLHEQLSELLNRITAGSISNSTISSMVSETIEIYVAGEAEFGECYEEFGNRLESYLAE